MGGGLAIHREALPLVPTFVFTDEELEVSLGIPVGADLVDVIDEVPMR